MQSFSFIGPLTTDRAARCSGSLIISAAGESFEVALPIFIRGVACLLVQQVLKYSTLDGVSKPSPSSLSTRWCNSALDRLLASHELTVNHESEPMRRSHVALGHVMPRRLLHCHSLLGLSWFQEREYVSVGCK
jgi:hypothetical protein